MKIAVPHSVTGFLQRRTNSFWNPWILTDSFQRLAELMVGEIADFVFVNTIEGNDVRTVAAAHRDAAWNRWSNSYAASARFARTQSGP